MIDAGLWGRGPGGSGGEGGLGVRSAVGVTSPQSGQFAAALPARAAPEERCR